MICEDRSRVVVVPIVVEPVVVRDPPRPVPVEVTDVEIAISVAESYEIYSVSPPLDYSQG